MYQAAHGRVHFLFGPARGCNRRLSLVALIGVLFLLVVVLSRHYIVCADTKRLSWQAYSILPSASPRTDMK
jgi:hypothetical protein